MPIWLLILIPAVTLVVFALIHTFAKRKRPIKSAFISMLIGILTLITVNLTSSLTGVYLSISLLSIIVSMILGVPGVTLLLALNLFF